MPEFLLELFSEEIPARMQKKAQDDLLKILKEQFALSQIPFGEAFSVSTPRRLTCVFQDVPLTLPKVETELRGPRTTVSDKVLEAFLKANGLSRGDVFEKDSGKGTYYFAIKKIPERSTSSMLPAIIDKALHALTWQKSMRWGHSTFRWVRPLRRIIAVFNEQPVEGRLDLGGGEEITYGNMTIGHRFLNPEPFVVKNYKAYEADLMQRHVVVDREKRKALILEAMESKAQDAGLTVVHDDELLEEVAGLVEWPVILKGQFDDRFLDLPPEVIATTLKLNQRYFTTEKAKDTLGPAFLFASNTETKDDGALTIKGNEKVIRARLSDAQFFWEQDIKTPLENRLEALRNVKFHEKLGSMHEKIVRMERLSKAIAQKVAPELAAQASRAAMLSKADLTTSLVFEFPELQGIVGHRCAHKQGEPEAIALAIKAHYAPQGPADSCPPMGVGAVVSLAEKVDNLTGFFSIDEVPTSSKDPFSLRRHALGALRVLIENKIDFDLFEAIEESAHIYGCGFPEKINAFVRARLKYYLLSQGCKASAVDAVMATIESGNAHQVFDNVKTLEEFLAQAAGTETVAAAYRLQKLIVSLSAEEKAQAFAESAVVTEALFQTEEEAGLFAALKTVKDAHGAALLYKQKLYDLHKLAMPLATFLDAVMVKDDDAAIRKNRYALLGHANALFEPVADFAILASDIKSEQG